MGTALQNKFLPPPPLKIGFFIFGPKIKKVWFEAMFIFKFIVDLD